MTKQDLKRKINSVASQISILRRKLREGNYAPEELAQFWNVYGSKVLEIHSLRLMLRQST